VLAIVVLIAVARTVRIVLQATAGIVERLGRYDRTLDPASFPVPVRRSLRTTVDLREQVVAFPNAIGSMGAIAARARSRRRKTQARRARPSGGRDRARGLARDRARRPRACDDGPRGAPPGGRSRRRGHRGRRRRLVPWSARSENEQPVAEGATVEIAAIDGVALVIREV